MATTLLTQVEDCEGVCSTCPSVGSCADRVVCRCLQVTETTIIQAIQGLGLRTVKEVKQLTKAGDGCMCCHREIKTYLQVYASSSSPIICSAK